MRTPEDVEAHPHDLNLYGGLVFDQRFHADLDRPPSESFREPFPDNGALPRACAGVAPPPIAGPDAEWRRLEGLEFVLWHCKYILCDGDSASFANLMQWFGFNFQK